MRSEERCEKQQKVNKCKDLLREQKGESKKHEEGGRGTSRDGERKNRDSLNL